VKLYSFTFLVVVVIFLMTTHPKTPTITMCGLIQNLQKT
jgi:hypothetical protein